VLGYTPGSAGDIICRGMMAHLPTTIHFLNRGLQSLQLFNVSADQTIPWEVSWAAHRTTAPCCSTRQSIAIPRSGR